MERGDDVSDYDVIVVGARCAGSPTAMLLARKGLRVLLVDRSTFPSDTVSTHLIHPPGVAALARWGLAKPLAATGCPPITDYAFDFGCAVLTGRPVPAAEGVDVAYGPRRTVLDALLVDAAAQAGAEVREGYLVEQVLFGRGGVRGVVGRSRGGPVQVDTAPLVIGADGKHSLVAETVQAPVYLERPKMTAGYYAYWSAVGVEQFQVFVRPDRAIVVVPTHDGLNLVLTGWPRAQYAENKRDIEGNYLGAIDLVPQLAERVRGGRRETRIVGTGDMPNAFRRPYGPGWALVGDAGYVRDPCTAQGITDSFLDAERLSEAAAKALGGKDFETPMREYQQSRDTAVRPMFDFTCRLAAMEPLPLFLRTLFRAVQSDQQLMDTFMGVVAGTVSPPDFFGPSSIARILAGGLRRRLRSTTADRVELTTV